MHGKLKAAGATLVALSPQKPQFARAMEAKLALDFPILFDEDNRIAKAYGLAFEFPEDLKEVYGLFKIDIARSNGTELWEVPMPARYVIGTDGKVAHAVIHPDYTKRPEPEETLAVVTGL